MHLFISVQSFLDDILGLSYGKHVREAISKASGRTPRQAWNYQRSGKIPPGVSNQIKHWLSQQGLHVPREAYDPRFEIPVAWKGFIEAIQKEGGDFLPRTFQLLHDLAEKDIKLIRETQNIPPEDRFCAYRKSLTDEIVPLYCLDPCRIADMALSSMNEKELKQPLYRIILESVLYLLSFAESEYVATYSSEHESILAKVLSGGDRENAITSPSKRFFERWMKTLGLDEEAFVQEMIDHFGEAGISDSENEDDHPGTATREGLKKSWSRYLKRGQIPSWSTIGKLSMGLHGRAIEIQGRDDHHTDYHQHLMDIYGGVRILDKLYRVGREVLPEAEVTEIMATYPARYETHRAALKEEAGQMPAS